MSELQQNSIQNDSSAQIYQQQKVFQQPALSNASPKKQEADLPENSKRNQSTQSEQKDNAEATPHSQKLSQQGFIDELRKINEIVINDISVKKGRKQKFLNHMNKVQIIQKNFEDQISIYSEEVQSSIYEKFSILFYNLARLGENQTALDTAILLLELSKSSRYLVVRWKMQLAAMRSSISHKTAYSVAVQTMHKILQILEELASNLKHQKPKLSSFLQLVLKVIKSDRKNDFIWVHNFQNNMKCFTDHIKLLILSSDSVEQKGVDSQQRREPITSSNNNIKIQSFFPDYDFQIADYMSLQKLEFQYIQKYNQLADIKEIIKEIVIYASICCFTQATESYYMGNYSLKYLHFKAIQIALLTVDKQCTYVAFLLKILNDYYGTKMSEIRQENSELMEINQFKRRLPRDKRQISMKNFCLADQ